MPKPTQPLEWQHIVVPLAGGLGTDADPRMRSPERLEVALNVRSPEIGTLGKRYGFTPLPTGLVDGGAIGDEGPLRALGATQRELLAIGHRSLYSWMPDMGGWYYRGHVSPYVGKQTELYRSTADYALADEARFDDVVVYACCRQERRESGGTWASIECRLSLVDGPTIGQPVELAGTATTTIPWGPSCATTGAGVVIIYATGGGAGLHSLNRATYNGAAPTTAPVVLDVIAAGDVSGASNDGRVWDVLGMANGTYVVAWIDAANDVQLRRYGSDHALLATSAIVGQFYRVALCQQCIEAEANPNLRTLYVAVEAFISPNYIIQAYKRDPGTLGPVAGPHNIRALGANARGQNLGCASGIDHNADESIAVSWLYLDVSVAPDVRATESNHTDNALGALGNLATCYNSAPLTRPWWYRTRCYSAIQTVHPDMIAASGFETHMLVDHEIATGANRQIRIAGMWGVGAAIGSANQCLQGSANHVWLEGTTKHRFLNPFLAEFIKATSDTWITAITHRISYDEIILDFDAVPLSCKLGRSMAVIGGGYVSLYDGISTTEMGFACPPMICTLAAAGAGTVPIAGTYQYAGAWVDQRGELLHRGMPSPPRQLVLAAPNNVLTSCYTLPATRRAKPDARIYRSGLDAIYRRVNRVGVLLDGTIDAQNTWTLTDQYNDVDLYIPLYTTGGVLEAVAPEGARYPVVIRGRLYLLDFYRGDRLQFSKELAPGTPGEVMLAPELYEALGRLSVDGSPLVAAAALDSATVVFSRASIYLLSGVGPDSRGLGDDMSLLTEIPSDGGCIEPRSVVAGPNGVFYQSRGGIYMLGRDYAVAPIGEPVRKLIDAYPVVTSAVPVSGERQVRFTVTNAAKTDGRILVYDYRMGQWYEWKIQSSRGDIMAPVSGMLANGTYYILDHTGTVSYEDTTTHYDDSNRWVQMMVETGEIQGSVLQWMHVARLAALGERKDAHQLNVAIYYNGSSTAVSLGYKTDAEIQLQREPAALEQIIWRPPTQQMQSFRFRIFDSADGTPTTGAGFEIHALAVEVALTGQLPQDGQQTKL